MERQGAHRFKGRPANFKAWLLRALGEFERAEELNWRERDEARDLGTGEAEAHALLDLADGQLRAGDLNSAAHLLDDAAPLQQRQHANRWRHQLRYRLLRARLAIALGSVEEAHASANRLSRDAREMGVPRYADLAFVLEVLAATALGIPAEHELVEAVLQRLPEHSGLEAWWLTSTVAAATNTDRYWNLAEAYAARLVEHAGEHAETFRAYAVAQMERIKRVSVHG
jgi:hypothetical protein